MRRPRALYPIESTVYTCEFSVCPVCQGAMRVAYTSGPKTVQSMKSVWTMVHQPRFCPNRECAKYQIYCRSAQWEQSAPRYCTYGFDVIAQIGWLRQMQYMRFEEIHESLQAQLQISESEVRYLYQDHYLPLLACHERQNREQLGKLSEQSGLLLGLDGLCPEGGEPQLWIVRELQTSLTLRCGWLSRQDKDAFVNFLQPIADAGLHVIAVLSDKQRGLEPALPVVFPQAKHGLCQAHYLKNVAEPVAEEDEAMKIALRKAVRSEIGILVRQEKGESPGVLTVTGLIPTPVELPEAAPAQEPSVLSESVATKPVVTESVATESVATKPVVTESVATKPVVTDSVVTDSVATDSVAMQREEIVQDILRRVRYLLGLKGRPPFRLAGIEMFERLSEVVTCLDTMLSQHPDARLLVVRQGLHLALLSAESDYTELQQAALWLQHISDLLDPKGKPHRSGAEVKQSLFAYLDEIAQQSHDSPRLSGFHAKIRQTSLNYASGLFHSYDVPGLPRTNNDRESEFRELNRRLLSTTGQRGLVKRIIHRLGAWELLPHPDSLPDIVAALSHVDPLAFTQERTRIRNHRNRFRLYTRSTKQSQSQLTQLALRWNTLSPLDSP